MPEEVMIIVIVAIIFGTVSGMVSNYLKYRTKKLEMERQPSMASMQTGEGNSMKTSELEALIAAAVTQALGPVEDELRHVRKALRRSESASPRALESGQPLIALDPLDEDDDALEPVRRSRTEA